MTNRRQAGPLWASWNNIAGSVRQSRCGERPGESNCHNPVSSGRNAAKVVCDAWAETTGETITDATSAKFMRAIHLYVFIIPDALPHSAL
jgi:hypothetical protein